VPRRRHAGGLGRLTSPANVRPLTRFWTLAGTQGQGLASVTPRWPCHLPPLTGYQVSQTSLDSKNGTWAQQPSPAQISAGGGVVLLNFSVAQPSLSGSNGVTLTMIPQRTSVFFPSQIPKHQVQAGVCADTVVTRTRSSISSSANHARCAGVSGS
jgi:hypothetical protein